MSGTLHFETHLLDLARSYLSSGRIESSISILERLLSMPVLRPDLVADANFLLAQARFRSVNSGDAVLALRQSLEADPDNAEGHYLLAQALDESDEPGEALAHFARAAQLDPQDGRKVAGYGRALARANDPNQGLHLLRTAYSEHSLEPSVVEDVVEGLIENEQFDEAELVVAQFAYRDGDLNRQRRLRNRIRVRSLESRMFGKVMGSDGSSEILAYRNPSCSASGKPGGAKRPKRRDGGSIPKKSTPVRKGGPNPTLPVALDENMKLVEILRRSGTVNVEGVYENLGFIGKVETGERIQEICCALSDADTLSSIVRRLPAASRKLLRTLVQLGGYAPASAVFQTDGPDTPPPDFAQPLFQNGLAYFGRSTKRRRGGMGLVVAVPIDLLGRLARVLRVKVGG